MALDQYSDNERLGLAAYWADDAATKLAAALNAGVVHGRSREGQDILDTLYDGLQTLAENLGALTLPFPPPAVLAPRRHLRVVKKTQVDDGDRSENRRQAQRGNPQAGQQGAKQGQPASRYTAKEC